MRAADCPAHLVQAMHRRHGDQLTAEAAIFTSTRNMESSSIGPCAGCAGPKPGLLRGNGAHKDATPGVELQLVVCPSDDKEMIVFGVCQTARVESKVDVLV
jgi:hypothetical protein